MGAQDGPGKRADGAVKCAVLCVRPGSAYFALPVDAYDALRDARTYRGPLPVVAHPPCALWGRLRAFAKGNDGEASLGPLCVDAVRRWGGVLEHPKDSTLWRACGLPRPGAGRDQFGGFTWPRAAIMVRASRAKVHLALHRRH